MKNFEWPEVEVIKIVTESVTEGTGGDTESGPDGGGF